MANKKIFSALLLVLGGACFAASYVVVWLTMSCGLLLLGGVASDPIPYFTSMEGVIAWPVLAWQVVTSLNWFRCTNDYRMTGPMIMKLLKMLRKDLKGTKKCPKHYQLLIYLDWVAFNKTYREQKAHFRVSFESIRNARREVGQAIMKNVYSKYVHLPSTMPDLTGQYFSKFFQGCYGCVDGSHFPIIVPTEEKEDWLNRKGGISTNGMLMCHSDNSLRFIYANFGAEGNGGDSVILRMCANDMGMEWLGGTTVFA
jgi:hypothetical protein